MLCNLVLPCLSRCPGLARVHSEPIFGSSSSPERLHRQPLDWHPDRCLRPAHTEPFSPVLPTNVMSHILASVQTLQQARITSAHHSAAINRRGLLAVADFGLDGNYGTSEAPPAHTFASLKASWFAKHTARARRKKPARSLEPFLQSPPSLRASLLQCRQAGPALSQPA